MSDTDLRSNFCDNQPTAAVELPFITTRMAPASTASAVSPIAPRTAPAPGHAPGLAPVRAETQTGINSKVLQLLKQSGEFNVLRERLFGHKVLQGQFQCMQNRILSELSNSPLLNVDINERAKQVPKVFQAFRHAIRNTSVR